MVRGNLRQQNRLRWQYPNQQRKPLMQPAMMTQLPDPGDPTPGRPDPGRPTDPDRTPQPGDPADDPNPDTFPDPMPDPDPMPVEDPPLPEPGRVVPPTQA